MTYKIIQSASFERDVENVVLYIAESLQDPQAARTLLDTLEKTFLRLMDFPESGTLHGDPYISPKGYRWIFIESYLLFYQIDEETETIRLVRFLYEKTDYSRYL